jgi:hypothetical protein
MGKKKGPIFMRPFLNAILPTGRIAVVLTVVIVGITFGFTCRYHPVLDLAIVADRQTSSESVVAAGAARKHSRITGITKGNH